MSDAIKEICPKTLTPVSSKRLSNKRGALLVEALLSVIILSVSITVIIQSMSASVRSTVYSSYYSTVLILMENKMFDLIRKGFVESGSSGLRRFPHPNDRFQYQLRIKKHDRENLKDINEIDLTVSWKAGSKDNKIAINTYLFDLEPE